MWHCRKRLRLEALLCTDTAPAVQPVRPADKRKSICSWCQNFYPAERSVAWHATAWATAPRAAPHRRQAQRTPDLACRMGSRIGKKMYNSVSKCVESEHRQAVELCPTSICESTRLTGGGDRMASFIQVKEGGTTDSRASTGATDQPSGQSDGRMASLKDERQRRSTAAPPVGMPRSEGRNLEGDGRHNTGENGQKVQIE